MPPPDRRAFLAVFASAGLTSTLLPGVLWAQMQQGTKPVTMEMVREAARLAGLNFSDEESQDLAASLSSLARGAEGIDKPTLSNASPLPIHFDPRPPGIPLAPLPAAVFRIEPAPRLTRPQRPRSRRLLARDAPRASAAHATGDVARAHRDVSGPIEAVQPAAELCRVVDRRARHGRSRGRRQGDLGRKYRGVLHGIPYGVKDIIAAKGYPTRWGAKPLDEQTFDEDATVVRRLNEAGAVLIAKLTTGELAFGDQWSGGRTNNPWNPAQGSSGSSAGSGAATAAGLVGFAIGTDTGGSILSPAGRCGIVGLRPTFGRVSRFGVMTAGSTLDKVGPMCRHAQDCAIVLHAIAGPDNLDLAVADGVPVAWDATRGRYPKRIGYVPCDVRRGTERRPPREQRARVRCPEAARMHACTRCRFQVATSRTSSSTPSVPRRSTR